MTIHNVALHIPKEIAVGLKSGKYKQFGSIIRNNNGQIVKHLTEIRIPDNAVKKLLGNKNVKYGLIGTSVVILAGGGYYGYNLLKINKLFCDYLVARSFEFLFDSIFLKYCIW